MNYFKYTLITLVLLVSNLPAQEKILTLEEVIYNAARLSVQYPSHLKWIAGSSNYSLADDSADDPLLLSVEAVSGKTDTIVSLSAINSQLRKAGADELKQFPYLNWTDSDNFNFWAGNYLIGYNTSSGKVEILNSKPENAENIDFSIPEKIAFTVENNLFISVDGQVKQITNDTIKGILNGQTVHRVEFGIYKGTFWSPGSDYLAFYRKDETMVTDYPVLNLSTRPASVDFIKYPMAGMTSEEVKVGVYDLNNDRITYLKTGKPEDQYLTGVTWSPDEKYIFIQQLNRDQNHMQLIKYDISSGEKVKVLFEEKNEKYVEPLNPLYFRPKHDDQFIYISRNSGWNHLFLYDTSGNLIRQLTEGEWEVKDFSGFSSDGEKAFFTATKDSPLESNFYSVDISSGLITRITTESGVHNVQHNEDGSLFIDRYSGLDVPGRILLEDASGNTLREIFTGENPLKEYKLGKTEFITLKSSDGYDLYGRIIYPPDFDEDKKYPVLVYVYGGPHAQLVTNSWLGGAGLWLNFMAQHGYIVFTLDNRGSANRGLEFEQVTFRNLGKYEIEDQLTGVEFLRSLHYVDAERMGVHGWSYGGFMTTSLMTRTPDIFRAGVAGGAVIDWSYYEVMYTERYMDTPEQNPDGFNESNLLNYVGSLKGKLLEVHGTSDPTVVWQHTLLFAEKAMKLGIDLDYYPYVGHQHGVRGKDRFHLYKKITDYFNQYLK
ncbi:MAG: S9 family peptidase [Ignavibacteriaceae bacterium]